MNCVFERKKLRHLVAMHLQFSSYLTRSKWSKQKSRIEQRNARIFAQFFLSIRNNQMLFFFQSNCIDPWTSLFDHSFHNCMQKPNLNLRYISLFAVHGNLFWRSLTSRSTLKCSTNLHQTDLKWEVFGSRKSHTPFPTFHVKIASFYVSKRLYLARSTFS